MREIQNTRAEVRKVQSDIEAKQVIKTLEYLGEVKVYPGQRLYEMIVVPRKAGDIVIGLDPETGSFDPEKAEVVPVTIKNSAYVFGLDVYAKMGSPAAGDEVGISHKVVITPGNFYEPAINKETARRKIIRKYFNPA